MLGVVFFFFFFEIVKIFFSRIRRARLRDARLFEKPKALLSNEEEKEIKKEKKKEMEKFIPIKKIEKKSLIVINLVFIFFFLHLHFLH